MSSSLGSLTVLVMGASTIGCAAGKSWIPSWGAPSVHETSLAAPQTAPASQARARSSSDTLQTIHLVMDITRVEFPVNGSRHARNVWNHLDRLRVEPEKVAILERNDLRIGVGGEHAWSPLTPIFEAADASVGMEQAVAQAGSPITIPLGRIDGAETIFIHGPRGGLAGRTFNGGDKAITLDYAVRPEFGGTTDLVVHFEIRRDTGTMTWERQADGTTLQVPAVERQGFEDLSTSVTLRPNEFLVIGIGDLDSNELLLGPSFLMRRRDSGRVETMLCITPRYFRTSSELRAGS